MTDLPPIITYLPQLWFNTFLGALLVYYFDLPLELLLLFFCFEVMVIFCFSSLQLLQHNSHSYWPFVGLNLFGALIAALVSLSLLPKLVDLYYTSTTLQSAVLLTPFATILLVHAKLISSSSIYKKLTESGPFSFKVFYFIALLCIGYVAPFALLYVSTLHYSIEF